jgi:hypothetical protein
MNFLIKCIVARSDAEFSRIVIASALLHFGGLVCCTRLQAIPIPEMSDNAVQSHHIPNHPSLVIYNSALLELFSTGQSSSGECAV